MAYNSLKTNEFYGGIYNAYKLLKTLADGRNFDDSLANKYREDGGMFHDQYVITDVDVLCSRPFDPYSTNGANLLIPELQVAPKQQTIVADQKRQIGLYTENYMSKRAWMDPGIFDEFNSVVQAQIGNTKSLYEQRLVDTYIGTTSASGTNQTQTITVTLPNTVVKGTEGYNRLHAQHIAKGIGDVFVKLGDSSRDFNDNKFMKKFNENDFDIIWNADIYNEMLYTDLPTVFHKDNLIKNGKVMPGSYFGEQYTTSATADGTNDRALEEYHIRVDGNGAYSASGTNVVTVYPGELLPKSTPIVAVSATETSTDYDCSTYMGSTIKSTKVRTYSSTHAYADDNSSKYVCKIVHKDGVKYLSSFETSSEFWNPKNLTTNRYLTWVYAKPEYVKGLPFITVKDNISIAS